MNLGFSKKYPDKWEYLNKKLVYPYELFNCPDDYQKPVNNLEKEDFFNMLKNNNPKIEKVERTKEISKFFSIQKGEKLSQLYLKSDVLFLADVFQKISKHQLKNLT